MNKKQDKEFETKVLNINKDELIKKLRSLGAKEIPEFLMRRYVFDIESKDIEWIRLRQGNDKATLTYKLKKHGNTKVGKTVEIEVEVSDFDKTARILKKLTFKEIYYQENKSHIFNLDNIEFSIDTWPKLKPYLEVESSSKKRVDQGLKLLELLGQDSGDKDIVAIYKENGIDLHSYLELKFD